MAQSFESTEFTNTFTVVDEVAIAQAINGDEANGFATSEGGVVLNHKELLNPQNFLQIAGIAFKQVYDRSFGKRTTKLGDGTRTINKLSKGEVVEIFDANTNDYGKHISKLCREMTAETDVNLIDHGYTGFHYKLRRQFLVLTGLIQETDSKGNPTGRQYHEVALRRFAWDESQELATWLYEDDRVGGVADVRKLYLTPEGEYEYADYMPNGTLKPEHVRLGDPVVVNEAIKQAHASGALSIYRTALKDPVVSKKITSVDIKGNNELVFFTVFQAVKAQLKEHAESLANAKAEAAAKAKADAEAAAKANVTA